MALQQEIEMLRRVNNIAERLIEQFGSPMGDSGTPGIFIKQEGGGSLLIKSDTHYLFNSPSLKMNCVAIAPGEVIGTSMEKCFHALEQFEDFARAAKAEGAGS